MIELVKRMFGTGGERPSSEPKPVYKKPIPRTDREFVAYVEKFVSEQRRMRYRFERTWLLNVAYYLGLHYYSWDAAGRNLREPQVPSYRVRLVVNAIMSTVETALAKSLKNKPVAEVRPSNTDENNMAGAKLGTKITDCLGVTHEDERKLHDFVKWMLICGTCFFHDYWDGQAGESWEDVDPHTGEPITLHMGDIGREVVSPFDVMIDPEAIFLNEAKRLVRRKRYLLNEACERWPDKADYIQPSNTEDMQHSMDLRILNLGMYSGESYGLEPHDHDNRVTVYEMWELPEALSREERRDFPKGRVITKCGNVLLSKDSHPYRHGQIPYTQANAIGVPGRLWGMSIIDQIGSINRAYNRALSKILENMVLMSNPKWLMPTSAAQGMNAIDSEPGGIIRFADGSTPPQAVPPPALTGQGHFEVMRVFSENMQEVSGLREVSRGSAPPGVTSGVAINLLQEQDDTRLATTIRGIERAIERSGKQRLELVQQFYIEPRVMKIAGEDSSFDSIDFTGADLAGNTDLVVVAGSAMPQSKTARQAMVMDYWNAGLLPQDDNGRRLAWRLLGIPNLEALWKEEQVDLNTADQENRRMRRGIAQPVYPWQDHTVHKARLDLVRKRTDFSALDPYIQQIFNDHYMKHEQMEQQLAMQAQQLQMPQTGPGGPGPMPPSNGAPSQPPPSQPDAGQPESPASPGSLPAIMAA